MHDQSLHVAAPSPPRGIGLTFVCLLACLVIGFAAIQPAFAAQTVYLSFPTSPVIDPDDVHTYSMMEKEMIRDYLEMMYGPFDITFTLTPPPVFTASTITFNSGGIGGSSDGIDFRNLDDTDDAAVNAKALLNAWETAGFMHPDDRLIEKDPITGDFPPDMMFFASANLAGHEFGHLVGLRHHDSFGPIGTGIGVSKDKYTPVYPGPDLAMGGAPTMGHHVMSLNSAVALSPANLLTPSWIGDRSAVKLAFNDVPAPMKVVPESEPNDALPIAQVVDLVPFGVPNTLMPPEPMIPPLFDFFATGAVVTGTLEGKPGPTPGSMFTETDYFEFFAEEGDYITIEVLSDIISAENGVRITDVVDPWIILLQGSSGDTPGAVIEYLPGSGVGAENDDQFESSPDLEDLDPLFGDSILFDVVAPYTGTYVVELSFHTASDLSFMEFGDEEAGDYEMFIYTFKRFFTCPPGDFDCDGDVDLDDFDLLATGWGTTSGAVKMDGDADGDEDVDMDDFVIHALNFGKYPDMESETIGSLPEPAVAVPLLTLCLWTRRRR